MTSRSWEGVTAVVAGLGTSGFTIADSLQHVGAHVIVLEAGESSGGSEEIALLEHLGVDVRLGIDTSNLGALDLAWENVDCVVASTLDDPASPVVAHAQAAGIEVYGDVELAWQLRSSDAAPWLCMTGAGSTTIARMLEAILHAAGRRPAVVGNEGRPILEAVLDDEPADVLVVDLSAQQLAWRSDFAAESAAVLNVAAGEPVGRVFEGVKVACIYNADEPATEQLVRDADVVEGARAIGCTLTIPSVGMLGVVDDMLADRAFVDDRRNSAAELAGLSDMADPEPETVRCALAAAGLARAHGVPPVAVRDGLRIFSRSV